MKASIIICLLLSFVSLYSAKKSSDIFYKNNTAKFELNGESFEINFVMYKDPETRKYLTFGLDDNIMSGSLTFIPVNPKHNFNFTIDRFDVNIKYNKGISRCALDPSCLYSKKTFQTYKQQSNAMSTGAVMGGLIGAFIAASAVSSAGDTTEPFTQYNDFLKNEYNVLNIKPNCQSSRMILFFDVEQIRKAKEIAVEITYYDAITFEKHTITIDL
jgi:hypothetical protein